MKMYIWVEQQTVVSVLMWLFKIFVTRFSMMVYFKMIFKVWVKRKWDEKKETMVEKKKWMYCVHYRTEHQLESVYKLLYNVHGSFYFGHFKPSREYYLWWNFIQDKSEYLCLENMSISTKCSFCHGKALSLFTNKYVSFFIYFMLFYFISFHSVVKTRVYAYHHQLHVIHFILPHTFNNVFTRFSYTQRHILFPCTASCVQSLVQIKLVSI